MREIEIPSDAEQVTSLTAAELLRPLSSRNDGMEVRLDHSNGRILMFSDAPEAMEAEPNNSLAEAQRVTIPCAVTGQFSAPKDIDHFTFTAKKDEKFTISVSAERLGSPADADMEIVAADGKIVNAVQDTGENIGQLRFPTSTRDIVYNFNAPKDGDFTVRLEHVYQQVQGGAQYQYRLEIQKDTPPDFRLVCTPDA